MPSNRYYEQKSGGARSSIEIDQRFKVYGGSTNVENL